MTAAASALPFQSVFRSRGFRGSTLVRNLLCSMAIVLMVGCTTRVITPNGQPVTDLPKFMHVSIEHEGAQAEDAILVVQRDVGDTTRWSLMNPLGAPLARQILQDGRWRNDGFLPPNSAASKLFAALVFAWTPQAELSARYPVQRWRLYTDEQGRPSRSWGREKRAVFNVHYLPDPADSLVLILGKTTWRLSPLPGAPR
jgi:hypothetical protein